MYLLADSNRIHWVYTGY